MKCHCSGKLGAGYWRKSCGPDEQALIEYSDPRSLGCCLFGAKLPAVCTIAEVASSKLGMDTCFNTADGCYSAVRSVCLPVAVIDVLNQHPDLPRIRPVSVELPLHDGREQQEENDFGPSRFRRHVPLWENQLERPVHCSWQFFRKVSVDNGELPVERKVSTTKVAVEYLKIFVARLERIGPVLSSTRPARQLEVHQRSRIGRSR